MIILAVKARTVPKGLKAAAICRLHTFVFVHALDYLYITFQGSSSAKYLFISTGYIHQLITLLKR
jgi:hypothetical protein